MFSSLRYKYEGIFRNVFFFFFQVFYLYFVLCIALCCVIELTELSGSTGECPDTDRKLIFPFPYVVDIGYSRLLWCDVNEEV